MPEIAKLISRETNRYAQKFLENKSDMKPKSRIHYWNDINRDEIMKLLADHLNDKFIRVFTPECVSG
jgi:hypothetical protein